MKEELMERLRQFLGRADNASLSGTPAGDEQIASAERLLDVRFDADYIEFKKRSEALMPVFPYMPLRMAR